MKTEITIVMPAFNAELSIEASILSVLNQNFLNFELLVIDDCSTDSTVRIVENIQKKDKRLKLLRRTSNGGVSAARNAGIYAAIGDYICFLDADDFWLPEKLRCQLNYMKRCGHDISYMNYSRVNERGEVIGNVRPPEKTTYIELLKTNSIGNLTAMVRSSVIKNIEFKAVGHEDYVFWLEVLSKVSIAHKADTDENMCLYTVRRGSVSGNKMRAIKWQWHVYREIIGVNLFVAFWNMANYAFCALFKRF